MLPPNPIEDLGHRAPAQLGVEPVGERDAVQAAGDQVAAHQHPLAHLSQQPLRSRALTTARHQLLAADLGDLTRQDRDRGVLLVDDGVAGLGVAGGVALEGAQVAAPEEHAGLGRDRIPVGGIEEVDAVRDHVAQAQRRVALLVASLGVLELGDDLVEHGAFRGDDPW